MNSFYTRLWDRVVYGNLENDYFKTKTDNIEIDKAIDLCRATILEHRRRAVQSALLAFGLFVIFSLVLWHFAPPLKANDNSFNQIGVVAYTGVSVLFTVFCALGASLYRSHAREIVVNENYVFDLFRIWIATKTFEQPAFKSDVRKSLVHGAFENRSDKTAKAPTPTKPRRKAETNGVKL